ncbi:capping complex subunit for YIEGIA [Sporosarcina pasteurii]|uniref:Uncharacterized protein n=1 Tax=Sporosarcina pasteurii TaxID=1474 RepID=A0A380BT63_SPOPA|nr:hypothetical protein [Sporosarcina pasteurii]MDS9471208.1 hypothetical protein [Sporosarcina pasteurii]QBQ05156.1 hypothetical protein E2C16_05485 [Sporosarcina pasteurii]SUJ05655.1 Uncharacterised protein [Sporosarcina pasteurii]
MSTETEIVAIVTTKKEMLQGGGAPVFIVNANKELQETAMNLEKILDAETHEISPTTLILVAR